MKKMLSVPLSFAFVIALAGMSGTVFAADQAQDALTAYGQRIAPLEQQLYAKQAELDAIYASAQPDTARAQQLFKEIGELQGQLFAAQTELRAQSGDIDAAYAGMHHPGEFSRRGGYMSHRGGYMGHRGGYMRHGGGHHGGW